MESEWIVSATDFVSRDSMTSATRSMIILLGCELALSVGAYDHPIPLIACYSRVYSHLLGIDTIPVSLLPVAVNDNICWKMVLSTRMISPLSEIVQSDQYWNALALYCNIPSLVGTSYSS